MRENYGKQFSTKRKVFSSKISVNLFFVSKIQRQKLRSLDRNFILDNFKVQCTLFSRALEWKYFGKFCSELIKISLQLCLWITFKSKFMNNLERNVTSSSQSDASLIFHLRQLQNESANVAQVIRESSTPTQRLSIKKSIRENEEAPINKVSWDERNNQLNFKVRKIS